MTVILEARELWYAGTNCYAIAAETGGLAIVVDAPPDPMGMGRMLAERNLTPIALLVTHGHVDHAGGAGAFVAQTGVAAYVHPDDDFLTLHPTDQLRRLFGVDLTPEEAQGLAPPERYEALADGQTLDLGGLTIEVLHTPGHTPGHCCLLVRDEGILFSGDQLFAGSIGRTDLPGGSFETLLQSMTDKVLPLPEDTRVLPGHGPATTLARERLTNPFLQELIRP
jgi:glyoxylase-like metal-dependent hydrolase (beta-lactamase superfamily II)